MFSSDERQLSDWIYYYGKLAEDAESRTLPSLARTYRRRIQAAELLAKRYSYGAWFGPDSIRVTAGGLKD